MEHLTILADDLTGAADTAARGHAAGLPATIFLTPPHPPLPAGAVAFTSDSRHLPPARAAQAVEACARPLRGLSTRWYKKIDSTLRGHIGQELDALLDVLNLPAAVVCPAFPAQGRGLRNGHLHAPNLPPVGVHLPSLLQEQSRYWVDAFSLADVRSGRLAERMQGAGRKRQKHSRQDDRRRLLVMDALTDGDLEKILDAGAQALPDALLCGSAGLAGAFAQRLAGQTQPLLRQATSGWQSALLVVGSGSPVAHQQIAHLRASGLAASDLALAGQEISPEISPAQAAATFPTERPVWLVHQPPPPPGTALDGPDARSRAQHLADVAAVLCARRPPDLLIVAGGDTAVQTLRRLGVARLAVQRELLPGMPLCRADVDGRAVRVVMKPGSFGGPGTLVELLEKAQDQSPA